MFATCGSPASFAPGTRRRRSSRSSRHEPSSRTARIKMKILHIDHGGEFTSVEFGEHCANAGVQQHFLAPYTPQQNGLVEVERWNLTVVNMVCSILSYEPGSKAYIPFLQAWQRPHTRLLWCHARWERELALGLEGGGTSKQWNMLHLVVNP